jgi:hypothetical protein
MGDFAAFAVSAARIATGVLGWSPDIFWSATVAELRMALEGRIGPEAGWASLADLERLKREFPDE